MELLQDYREEYLHEIRVATDFLNKTQTALPKRKKLVSWTLLKIRTLYQETILRGRKKQVWKKIFEIRMSNTYPKYIKNSYKPIRNR